MKRHLKRMTIPRTWPLRKKGKIFMAKGEGPQPLKFSMPLTVILRDVLKILNTAKEAKMLFKENAVLVNNGVVKEMKSRVGLFDRIHIKKMEKYFSLYLTENGKLEVKEISKEHSERKPCKIIGKKVLKGNKVQINCGDGRNFLVSNQFKVGDTLIVDLKTNKISKHLDLAKGAFVLIYEGKNIGKHGKIDSLDEKTAIVHTKDKKISVLKENIFIVEENELKR